MISMNTKIEQSKMQMVKVVLSRLLLESFVATEGVTKKFRSGGCKRADRD